MLESSGKGFPTRWVTISEAGVTRAQIDHWVRQGRIFVLIKGSECWYSADFIEEALADESAERLGGEKQEKRYADEPPACSKTGNLHR